MTRMTIEEFTELAESHGWVVRALDAPHLTVFDRGGYEIRVGAWNRSGPISRAVLIETATLSTPAAPRLPWLPSRDTDVMQTWLPRPEAFALKKTGGGH